jgi:hypothetical protein
MEAKNQGRDALALDHLREFAVSLGADPSGLDWDSLLRIVDALSDQVRSELKDGFLGAVLMMSDDEAIAEMTILDFAPRAVSQVAALIAIFADRFIELIEDCDRHCSHCNSGDSCLSILGSDIALAVMGAGDRCGRWGSFDPDIDEWTEQFIYRFPTHPALGEDGKLYLE